MALPYRFGVWWQRASGTFAQGWGMCATKSNLQVALMRAAGLEAGLVEVADDAMMIKPLIRKCGGRVFESRKRHHLSQGFPRFFRDIAWSIPRFGNHMGITTDGNAGKAGERLGKPACCSA
jgi:hypothetical protein